MNKVLVVLAAVGLLLICAAAQAAVWDLSSDWSDVQNPMGVWSLKKSPAALFTINGAWGDSQHAWYDVFVPVWMKRSNGDIWAHGAEFDYTGTNQTSVVFTSPREGAFKVTGAIWEISSNRRSMSWELRKNGAVLSAGTVITDGRYTRSSPFNLATGTGGPTVLEQNLGAGDQIELAFISNSQGGRLGDFLGLTIVVGSVPEPSSLLALSGGLACLISVLRRRR